MGGEGSGALPHGADKTGNKLRSIQYIIVYGETLSDVRCPEKEQAQGKAKTKRLNFITGRKGGGG